MHLVLHCYDFGTGHLPFLSTHSSTLQSALVQNISVLVYLLIICFIIFTGASQVDTSNYIPYAPFGADVSAWAGTGRLGKGNGDVFLWGDGSGLVGREEGVDSIHGLGGCAAAARGLGNFQHLFNIVPLGCSGHICAQPRAELSPLLHFLRCL